MNNTKTLAAIAAIFIAATLVVGGTFAAITGTQSALAYQKKKGGDEKNGNTVTIQKCKQDGTGSGFDNDLEQECGNTICTHPGDNATCVSESVGAVTPTSTSTSVTPAPIPVTSTVNCNVGIGNCCFIIQTGTTNGATGGTTTCSVAITCTASGNAGDGTVDCANLPTGTLVSTTAIAMKSSDAKCSNGASGSLNTGTGRTFSVCVSV
jgi:hypothetical protein